MRPVTFVAPRLIFRLVSILGLFWATPFEGTTVLSAGEPGLKSDASSSPEVRLFESHSDVGNPRHAGAVEYDRERKSYLITGGGKNMWGQEDAFHFVWKRMSGDVALTA